VHWKEFNLHQNRLENKLEEIPMLVIDIRPFSKWMVFPVILICCGCGGCAPTGLNEHCHDANYLCKYLIDDNICGDIVKQRRILDVNIIKTKEASEALLAYSIVDSGFYTEFMGQVLATRGISTIPNLVSHYKLLTSSHSKAVVIIALSILSPGSDEALEEIIRIALYPGDVFPYEDTIHAATRKAMHFQIAKTKIILGKMRSAGSSDDLSERIKHLLDELNSQHEIYLQNWPQPLLDWPPKVPEIGIQPEEDIPGTVPSPPLGSGPAAPSAGQSDEKKKSDAPKPE
jgi:hypothetical protein